MSIFFVFDVLPKELLQPKFLTGIYECQVSSEPKLSLPFRLTVVGELKIYSELTIRFLYEFLMRILSIM